MRTSVVVPSYRSWGTLPLVLDALAPQLRPRHEVILVESGGDGTAAEVRRRYPWVRVLEQPERCLPGRARNLGVAVARGEALAFLDADAVPSPVWLEELEAAFAPGVDLVAGGVRNGTPWSATGTAGFLLEFLDWIPADGAAPRHAASCSMLVRRDAFEAAGGFPEDVWPGEDTILSCRIAASGGLAYAGGAEVLHLNRQGLRPFLAHQRALGAGFARAARRAAIPGGRFAAPPLVLVAGPLRLVSLALRLRGRPIAQRRALKRLPFLLLGLVAWNVGAIRAR